MATPMQKAAMKHLRENPDTTASDMMDAAGVKGTHDNRAQFIWRMLENDMLALVLGPSALFCPECQSQDLKYHKQDDTLLICKNCSLTFDPIDWPDSRPGVEHFSNSV